MVHRMTRQRVPMMHRIRLRVKIKPTAHFNLLRHPLSLRLLDPAAFLLQHLLPVPRVQKSSQI